MNSKSYLSFTKRERLGIITLLALLLIIVAAAYFTDVKKPVAEIIPPDQFVKRKLYPDSPYYNNGYPRKKYSSYNGYKKYNYKQQYFKDQHADNRGKRTRKTNQDYPVVSSKKWTRVAPAVVEINTGDTTAFIALPGIGSKLALRIISFRSRLGGFRSVDQIGQVYGIRDSVFQQLRPYLACDSPYTKPSYASVAR